MPRKSKKILLEKAIKPLRGFLMMVFMSLFAVDISNGQGADLLEPSAIPVPAEKVEKVAPAVAKRSIKDKLYDDLQNSVNGLSNPIRWENAVRIPIDVTTENKKARFYARQGFGLLQNKWDLEAHRSFVYALKQDKDCIVPYVGLLILSSERHNPSNLNQKALASVVLSLKNKKKGEDYVYTLQERLYAEVALCMVEGIQDDLTDSVNALVKEYPMDFQALIMQRVLLPIRSGANSVNEKSKFIGRMMKNYPLVPILWVYWLSIHEFQNDPQFLKNEVIPYSAKLVKWAPEMPVWYLYHGMFLHKAEQFGEADKSLDKAIEIYTKWGKESNIPKAVNAPLWQAMIFKSVNFIQSWEV